MRRSSASLALVALVALTAVAGAGCSDDRGASPPPPPSPDPRLEAAFVGVVSASIRAADKARELDREARDVPVRALRDLDLTHDDAYDDDAYDDDGGDLAGVVGGVPGGVAGGVVGGVLGGPPPGLVGTIDRDPGAPGVPGSDVRLLYRHGLRAYPAAQVDRQAAVVRTLVTDCLADDTDLAERIQRAGGTTVTVRIDHGQDPPRVWASGASGLGACVKGRLTPMRADRGTFVTSIRIDG